MKTVFIVKNLVTGEFLTNNPDVPWSDHGARATEFRKELRALRASRKAGRRLKTETGLGSKIAVIKIDV